MKKSAKIAVIQMGASPASIKERLARAETVVARCAANAAQLIVLPEVFNTGYEYSDQNYLQAESFDGLTASWMRTMVARYHVHLAGSFLRREQNDIFNTLLLVAPDERQWHYDKNYPWLWERAYFRKGANITVAHTNLGKIGYLICWDVVHPHLWQKYSAKVELMIVSSCPPRAHELTFMFPDGKRMTATDTGMSTQYANHPADKIFGEYLRNQASFLGVPVAHATSTGVFSSSIPNPKVSLAMLGTMYPSLLKHNSQLDHIRMEGSYFNETYITDSSGMILQSAESDTEGFAVSDVILPDSPPSSKGKQPSFGIPRFMYLIDPMAEFMFASEYRKKTQRYLQSQFTS